MKKYEREIRELLDKMDSFVPETPAQEKERNRDREPEREPRKRPVGVMPPQPIPIRSRRRTSAGFRQWLAEHRVGTAMQLMLGGLFLVILAMIVWDLLPSWFGVAQVIGAVGAVIFVMPVLLRFFGGRSLSDGPKAWRGQSVDSDSFSWNSVRRWFGGRRNRRNNDPWNDRKGGKQRW